MNEKSIAIRETNFGQFVGIQLIVVIIQKRELEYMRFEIRKFQIKYHFHQKTRVIN